MSDIKYEIIKKIGVLSKSTSGWAKELNLISWNDREPKYDLRDWSADGTKMGKGAIPSESNQVGLIVRPEVAQKQLEAEAKPPVILPPTKDDQTTTNTGGTSPKPEPKVVKPKPAPATGPKRYHGTATPAASMKK